MLASFQRFAACLGLTGYLLVATIGSWLHGQLHDHGPALVDATLHEAAPHEHACCGHSHVTPPAAAHAGCGHDADGRVPCPHSHDHGPLHDDDCFVCQVLAASRCVSAPVVLVVATGTIEPARPAPVVVPDAPPAPVPAPRGPPCPVV